MDDTSTIMIHGQAAGRRELTLRRITADLVVVGGGMAGTCCAITAARLGLKVVLLQDRPVLGGNASSEVRLWILGATSHLGNNNRWAREGGVIDEILVENLYRNPEGNPVILDTLLLEKVVSEPGITLLLNTAVHDLTKSGPDTIASVRAFCAQNSTAYEVSAPLFCDASGDGIVGFLAGAAFRMGAEASAEFGEKFAPAQPNRELLGNTLFFWSKDTGRPVRFIPPSFALKDITQIPRWRDFNAGDQGCRLWWIEWGGRLDIIAEAEAIKWELWKVVYGVWDHIKNSGRFPQAETLTLEWVGSIPGKRESRRFEGDYLLTQMDVVEQRRHADAVAFGGLAIDLHPADGVYSAQAGCSQWHAKGVYPIPYRCLYSRNLTNLFLGGRLISASHIAFGSTRVMATCAHAGQAVAAAAVLCVRDTLQPRDLLAPARLEEMQRILLRTGQYIPGLKLSDPRDLARAATVRASSELELSELKPNSETLKLDDSWAMLLPVGPGPVPRFEVIVDVEAPTVLEAELRQSSQPANHTPDVTLDLVRMELPAGPSQAVALAFGGEIDQPRYLFLCLRANPHIRVRLSDQRVTGVLSLTNKAHRAVAKSARQEPPPDSGLDTFEFWIPQRRPLGKNFALRVSPPLARFGPRNLVKGIGRPTHQPNAWVADFADPHPAVILSWDQPQTVARLELVFDTDYDHPMESVMMGHPERVMPFCVADVVVTTGQGTYGGTAPALAGAGAVVAEIRDNHQSQRVICLEPPVTTDRLMLTLRSRSEDVPAALFAVRCYARKSD